MISNLLNQLQLEQSLMLVFPISQQFLSHSKYLLFVLQLQHLGIIGAMEWELNFQEIVLPSLKAMQKNNSITCDKYEQILYLHFAGITIKIWNLKTILSYVSNIYALFVYCFYYLTELHGSTEVIYYAIIRPFQMLFT